MMRIEVSATGNLKKYVPEKKTIEVEKGMTLKAFKMVCGMEAKTTAGFVVNGRVARGTDILKDGDTVKFIMIVGAG